MGMDYADSIPTLYLVTDLVRRVRLGYMSPGFQVCMWIIKGCKTELAFLLL